MKRVSNPLKWIKSHWAGSALSIVTGVTIPILDVFVDIWATLGKIRPINGFPLWLIILIGCLLVIGLSALLISRKLGKPAFLLKENVRTWVKYSILAFAMLLAGVFVSVLNTSVKNKNDRRMFKDCLALEAQYLNEGTHGLREFYNKDYGAAYDSLKIYCNSDPVSACYYAEIIFDGLWKGVEQHETTNAIRLIDSSANLQFYRAIFKMEDYYYRQNMGKEAMQYAEQLLRVSSLYKKQETDTTNSTAAMQSHLWSGYCGESLTRIMDYCIANEYDRNEIKKIVSFYYTYLSRAGIGNKKLLDILHEQKNILIDWRLGYKKSAERQAKRFVRKHPGESIPARLYASILLNFDDVISHTDTLRIQKAEMVLIEALKTMSQKALSDPYPELNETEMLNVASYLTLLYDSTGYWVEAAEMDHLATAYMLINKYRAYETANK